MHVKKISLIYRRSENAGHFPLNLDNKSDQHSDVMNEKVNDEKLIKGFRLKP